MIVEPINTYHCQEIFSCHHTNAMHAMRGGGELRIETRLLEDGAGVRARVLFGLVERRAVHHPGAGCALD